MGQSDADVALVSSSSVMKFNLTALKKFVVCEIQMLAYTAVGDGAISLPALSVRTFEDGTHVFLSTLYCIFTISRTVHTDDCWFRFKCRFLSFMPSLFRFRRSKVKVTVSNASTSMRERNIRNFSLTVCF